MRVVQAFVQEEDSCKGAEQGCQCPAPSACTTDLAVLYERFGHWRAHAERLVWADVIVLA